MPIDLGNRRELFVDHHLIHALDGASLQLQHPQPMGSVLTFDHPWEGRWAGAATVIQDEDRFRMYYRGMPRTGDATDVECTCYAESPDGIHWTKPLLGLYEYEGHGDTNIIIHQQTPASTNFCPFLDRRPGASEDARFKALCGTWRKGIVAYGSTDGVHWRRLQEAPVLTSDTFAFDSQNVPFWSETEGCYVFYFRTFHEAPGSEAKQGWRWVSRATSDDFLHWSDWVEMDQSDAPWEEIYNQQTHPYFRAPHIYVSLAARFQPKREVLTEEQKRAIDVHPQYNHDCSDAVFMTSRGGNRYDRTFLESFLRPGPGYGHWVSRANYPALGVIPTGPGQMSMFANRRYAQPTSYLERYVLRTDGFVSLHAGYAGGEMVTKPLTFDGRELEINYATSAAGSVQIEIQDGDGQPVAGHALVDSAEIIGDELDRVVSWADSTHVSALTGRPVRLRFALKDADVFSFRFR